MAYTLASTVTEIRALINEDVADYWSDSEIQNWIKEGVLDWCAKSLLYMRHDTITLATDTQEYTASGSSYISNALRTLHADYEGRALQRISYEQINKHNARALGGDDEPYFFFDHYNGTTLTFYIGPTPTATYNSETVNVVFACRTDDITAIPWEYQPTVFLYAAHKAKFKERQYQEAYLYYQQYINNIVFSRADNINRGVQTTDAFKVI